LFQLARPFSVTYSASNTNHISLLAPRSSTRHCVSQSAGAQYVYGTQQAYGGMSGDQANPNAVCITDEYGHKYNRRGDRIGGPRR
jgi:hypothetical protein